MLMCILNLPTVLRMCYHQLATHIKTYEYQNYLIGRYYNPTLVKKQLKDIGKLNRTQIKIQVYLA